MSRQLILDGMAEPLGQLGFEAMELTGPARELGSRGSRRASLDEGLSHASAAVLAGVPRWWEEQARAVGLRGQWTVVHRTVDLAPIGNLGVDPADLSGLSPEDIAHLYVSGLPSATRSAHGRHYTPQRLADQLWQLAARQVGLSWSASALTTLVRDPACGAGMLLLPALRAHIAGSCDQQPELVLRRLPSVIEGTDLDQHAVWLANALLAAECLSVLVQIPEHRRERLPALARVGDGLTEPEMPAGIVVMNPPYGRVRLSPGERDRFDHLVRGHANLYGLFLGLHVEHLTDDGVLAAVVPTSFTSGAYFTNLRRHLATTAPLCDLAFVADRSGVFGSVLQETCLATFARSSQPGVSVARIAHELTRFANTAAVPPDRPWLLPRHPEDAPLALASARLPLTLGAAGWKASTGPLVWNRRKTDLYGRPGRGRVRVVWAADIRSGQVVMDSSRDDMRFLALTRDSDQRVMVLNAPAILVQRTTAPEQSRRLVTAVLTEATLSGNGGAVVVENHVNVVRPRMPNPLVSTRLLSRLLASRHLDRLMRCISGSVAVSAFELEALPLPDAATLQTWDSLSDADLNSALDQAYGALA